MNLSFKFSIKKSRIQMQAIKLWKVAFHKLLQSTRLVPIIFITGVDIKLLGRGRIIVAEEKKKLEEK